MNIHQQATEAFRSRTCTVVAVVVVVIVDYRIIFFFDARPRHRRWSSSWQCDADSAQRCVLIDAGTRWPSLPRAVPDPLAQSSCHTVQDWCVLRSSSGPPDVGHVVGSPSLAVYRGDYTRVWPGHRAIPKATTRRHIGQLTAWSARWLVFSAVAWSRHCSAGHPVPAAGRGAGPRTWCAASVRGCGSLYPRLPSSSSSSSSVERPADRRTVHESVMPRTWWSPSFSNARRRARSRPGTAMPQSGMRPTPRMNEETKIIIVSDRAGGGRRHCACLSTAMLCRHPHPTPRCACAPH